jgi:hypothetical protein
LSSKDLKAFKTNLQNHLENCQSGKVYLISTITKFSGEMDGLINVILREDILSPITNYALALVFDRQKEASKMDLSLLFRDDKIWREQREEEKKIKLAKKAKLAEKAKLAKKAKPTKKAKPVKMSKKGKEVTDNDNDEGSSTRPKTVRKSSKKVQNKGTPVAGLFSGIEKVGWRQVILREIYQIHDDQGRIDLNYLASGKKGSALYQQVTCRKTETWGGSVKSLRGRIGAVLRELGKANLLVRDGKVWTFTYPISNKNDFRNFSWEAKWEHIKNFATIFNRLPEQKDAVNPILTELWLARQQIDHAIDRNIELINQALTKEESFDPDSFLADVCEYINQKDLLSNVSAMPVMLPIAI